MSPVLLVCAVGFLVSVSLAVRTIERALRSANAGRGPTSRETLAAAVGYEIAALAFVAVGSWNVAIS